MKKKKLNLKLKTPRIVVADVDVHTSLPFWVNERVLLLGEIHNMKGHVAVVNESGRVLWGYHPEIFREATKDEI